MDLDARTREFFAALDGVQVERILSFMADGVRYEVRGALEPMGKAELERYLRAVRRRLPKVQFTVLSLAVKRNVAFAEWTCTGALTDGAPFQNRGVHVLSWDQDGRLAHVSVHTQPDAIQSLLD